MTATCGQMRNAGAYVPPHRPDHELFESEDDGPDLVTWETGRVYVLARDIASLCGLSVLALDTRHRPDAWACPRDFRLNGQGKLLFALASLPQLADALQANEQPDAALRLREWLIPQLERVLAARASQPREPIISATVTGTPEPVSRILKWERDHDF